MNYCYKAKKKSIEFDIAQNKWQLVAMESYDEIKRLKAENDALNDEYAQVTFDLGKSKLKNIFFTIFFRLF